MYQDQNQALEQAASLCFERAGVWKTLEQEALGMNYQSVAQRYTYLCIEADECKNAIRSLKIEKQETERDVVLAMLKLCDEAAILRWRPDYAFIRNQLNLVLNNLPEQLIIVRYPKPS